MPGQARRDECAREGLTGLVSAQRGDLAVERGEQAGALLRAQVAVGGHPVADVLQPLGALGGASPRRRGCTG